MPITAIKPAAYSAPSCNICTKRCCPVRNATSSTVGVGKRPWIASAEATIIASVAEGSSASASGVPTNGTIEASDIAAMVIKNSAAIAMGWRQNTPMPPLTQMTPEWAGTILSFMWAGW